MHLILKYAHMKRSAPKVTVDEIHRVFFPRVRKRSDIQRAMNSLERYGFVHKTNDGYRITEDGHTAIMVMAPQRKGDRD